MFFKDSWEKCKRAYEITEEDLDDFKGNPIDGLEPLAEAGGPMVENINVLEERYKALGGSIRVIAKEGVGHHPHSLRDPKEIVEFMPKACDR